VDPTSSVSIGCRIVAEFDEDAGLSPAEAESAAVPSKLQAQPAGNGMTIEQLRAAHQAMPFRPFTLHLADGRQLYASRPEFLSHSPSGRTLIVFQADDSFCITELPLVVDLGVYAPRSPNGQAS